VKTKVTRKLLFENESLESRLNHHVSLYQSSFESFLYFDNKSKRHLVEFTVSRKVEHKVAKEKNIKFILKIKIKICFKNKKYYILIVH